MASNREQKVAPSLSTALQFSDAGRVPSRVSVIIPVFDERESLSPLYVSLTDSLSNFDYELVFVDDGSRDGSVQILQELQSKDPDRVRVVELRRNFGQTAAIAAGIDHSIGDIVVLIDADMQNDPADIPAMLSKVDEGYDLVSGWRVNRRDRFLTRRLPSTMANWLISRVTGVALHDYGCTLKAYRRDVLQGFRLYVEMHRFIPVYAGSVGARITEMPVRHHPRRHGHTKYGLNRTFKVLLDLLTVKFLVSYAHKPIYLFGGAGMVGILTGAGVLFFLLARRTLFAISVINSPLFLSSIMVVILGFQSIFMGLIAELLVRTSHESQSKPTYSIRQVLGADDSSSDP